MLNSEKKITIEWINKDNKEEKATYMCSNPMTSDYSGTDKLSLMIVKVLNEEFPMIKNNSLLYDLVLYTLVEKLQTVQNVEKVVSCMKSHNARTVNDISFNNGEVFIKCSV